MTIAPDWPDALIATLKRMYADGASAAEIGAAVGRSRKRRPQPPYRQARGLEARLLRIKGESFEPRTDNVVDLLTPDQSDCAVPFLNLGPQHCRWPLADGFFCGAEQWPGKPYCARHCCIAYRMPGERAA